MNFINGMWSKLFSSMPTTEDLRINLKEIEREQKAKRRDMEVKEEEKAQKMRAAVAAQKAGKRELLQDIYRDLQQAEIDKNYISKDLRRLSLSKTALNSFLRKVESLEKRKDRKSMESLIVRFNSSKELQRALDSGDVTDDAFNSLLEGILDDETSAVMGNRVREDSGFRAFEEAIGKISEADSTGEPDLSRFQEDVDRAIKAEKVRDE